MGHRSPTVTQSLSSATCQRLKDLLLACLDYVSDPSCFLHLSLIELLLKFSHSLAYVLLLGAILQTANHDTLLCVFIATGCCLVCSATCYLATSTHAALSLMPLSPYSGVLGLQPKYMTPTFYSKPLPQMTKIVIKGKHHSICFFSLFLDPISSPSHIVPQLSSALSGTISHVTRKIFTDVGW